MLTAAFSAENEHLQRALADAVASGTGQGTSAGASLRLSTRTDGRELRLTAIPFAASLPGRGVRLATLVFVTDAGMRPQSRAAAMRALFSLTPIETRVADLLLEGLEIKEIAARLGLTVETSRFHVKRLLAKTGTNRQTELLKLMLSLPADNQPALK
jgi:DNA-binding CsgD family transcriptional regulator